jgi:GH15 family glucan-1,4-alpha-glucosidase
MRMELILRFDYGSAVPWVTRQNGTLCAVAGPDAVALRTPVATAGQDMTTVAEFTVDAGDRVPFVLTWHPSHLPAARAIDAEAAIRRTTEWWTDWSRKCTYTGPWADAVRDSLVVLKALTYGPTGGIVAAPTTSLPEFIGGVRNWDYRFCWLRDATFTLYALLISGYADEARAWHEWLLRSAAGDFSQLQILYGVAGERRLPELELDWLPGFEGSRPVRIGNAAVLQQQLDVYGELADVMHQCRKAGLKSGRDGWQLERELLRVLERVWSEPDAGIWEIRGPRQHFTHSKVMAWVAFDRAIKAVERFQLDGPVDRWREIRAHIHADVCAKGFDTRRQCFTQAYGSSTLDASLLMIPLVGFLPPSDPRIAATVAAIEQDLLKHGFVLRYPTEETDDGLPTGEGAFLPCTFWLADNYALLGRHDEAKLLFERLLALRNDVGLLSEEYDPAARRQLGNFPQAFSHVALVNTAFNLTPRTPAPAEERGKT